MCIFGTVMDLFCFFFNFYASKPIRPRTLNIEKNLEWPWPKIEDASSSKFKAALPSNDKIYFHKQFTFLND